jgi:hypothetical protein
LVVVGYSTFEIEREERARDRLVSVYIIMEKEEEEMEEKFELWPGDVTLF